MQQKQLHKFLFTLLFSPCIFASACYSQHINWAKGFEGLGYSYGLSVKADAAGNSYVTGGFQGIVDFDPGPGKVYLPSSYGTSIFIAKYNVHGDYVWAKSITGSTVHDYGSYGRCLVLDSSGYIYITGNFDDTLDFDPGPGTALLSCGISPANNKGGFIAKYDTSGHYIWAINIGATQPSSQGGGKGICLDGLGNIFVTGCFNGPVDFDPSPSTALLSAASGGTSVIFIAKYDTSGNYVWAKKIGTSGVQSALSITLDTQENLYITGCFGSSVDFDPGPGTALLSSNTTAAFVAKYTSNGSYVWAKSVGATVGNGSVLGLSIARDNAGFLYTLGSFQTTVDFDPGSNTSLLTSAGGRDVFLLKFTENGDYVWAKKIGGSLLDEGSALALDRDANLYVTGSFSGTVDFDPGPGVANLVCGNLAYGALSGDIYLAKFDSSGDYKWALSATGYYHDAGSGLTIADTNTVILAGTFEAKVDFDPGPDSMLVFSGGAPNFFLARYGAACPNSLCNEQQLDYFLPGRGKVYYVQKAGLAVYTEEHARYPYIIEYDPFLPVSFTNPRATAVTMPLGYSGLAVGDNISGPGPSPTYYTVVKDTSGAHFHYFNGQAWINTGHQAGQTSDGHGLGAAGGGVIYSFGGSQSSVYSYDGTGNASFMGNFGGYPLDYTADIVGDCQGNFQINQFGNVLTMGLHKYSPAGNLIQIDAVPGPNFSNDFSGENDLAMINDTVFSSQMISVIGGANPLLYPGDFTHFSHPYYTLFFDILFGPNHIDDMASCPHKPFQMQNFLKASIDTGYACGTGSSVQIISLDGVNPAPANWSVLSGNAMISKVWDDTVSIVCLDSVCRIKLTSTCLGSDTVTLLGAMPRILVVDSLITGCDGMYLDTISCVFTGARPFINYTYNWSPSGSIISGSNTLRPVVNPSANTSYVITVTTPSHQGGCTWTDTVNAVLADSSVVTDFEHAIKYGCWGPDTVLFNSISLSANEYAWDFGDGGMSADENPEHRYAEQDLYSVTLIASNSLCSDTVIKHVTNTEPKIEKFDLGADIELCSEEKIDIKLNAKIPMGGSSFWNDQTSLPYLFVTEEGSYWVTVIKNGCSFSDSINVIRTGLCDCNVMHPTAFSPNSDGRNDMFRPVIEPGCMVKGYQLQIFNRWGQKIFVSYKPEDGWDGTFNGQPLEIGTYMFNVQFEAGTKHNVYQQKGDVTIIR